MSRVAMVRRPGAAGPVLLALVAAISSALGCAQGTRLGRVRVELVEEREDRWAQAVGDQTIVVYAEPRLRREVELLFAYLSLLEQQGLRLGPGYRLHFGWTTLTLNHQRGEFVFYEPDYDAEDPEGASREDISASLDVLTAQNEVLALARRGPEPVDFDQHVLVSRGALEQREVYMVRVKSPGARLTGWRIAPTEGDVSMAEVDSIPLHALYKRRPDLLSAMLLPAGYMAFFDAEGLDVIVNERDEAVWRRPPPPAAGTASEAPASW